MVPNASPRVSILLPAYNAAGTLAACLASVQRQTEREWECLVIDDGSTDATLECARSFARVDRRIRVVAATHRGLVTTLNAGLGCCRAPYVARMDADDLMHRERLGEQLALLDREPRWVAAGCHVRLFPRRGLGAGLRAYETWLNRIDSPTAVRREAYVECPIAHPSLVLRREAIPPDGYRDRGWPEDYDLILRLLSAGGEVGVLARRRLSWRRGSRRLSRVGPAYAIERFVACKASFLAGTFLAAADHYGLWGYGSTGRSLCRALAALGKRPAYIVETHPGRLGNRIHGAPVVPPAALRRLPRLPLVVSVAGAAPRGRIRRALEAAGFDETRDFVCAA